MSDPRHCPEPSKVPTEADMQRSPEGRLRVKVRKLLEKQGLTNVRIWAAQGGNRSRKKDVRWWGTADVVQFPGFNPGEPVALSSKYTLTECAHGISFVEDNRGTTRFLDIFPKDWLGQAVRKRERGIREASDSFIKVPVTKEQREKFEAAAKGNLVSVDIWLLHLGLNAAK